MLDSVSGFIKALDHALYSDTGISLTAVLVFVGIVMVAKILDRIGKIPYLERQVAELRQELESLKESTQEGTSDLESDLDDIRKELRQRSAA